MVPVSSDYITKCEFRRKAEKIDNTNTGTLIPPTDFQRGIPSPVRAPDSGPGVYLTTVNMLHEARDVLNPQNPQNFQNMQFYPVPAMVNYGTSELSRHSIQYTPGVGQYPSLHSSVNSQCDWELICKAHDKCGYFTTPG